MKLEIGAAQWCCRGETVCGDAYSVFEDGKSTTVSVVDGLGHGEGAKEASQAFVRSIEQRAEAAGDDLAILMESASTDIARTRGVQAAILRLDTEKKRLCFLGVGNIDIMTITREPISPISMAGIVGRPIRKTKQFDYSIAVGDLIAVFSDGISARFDLESYLCDPSTGDKRSAEELAGVILKENGRKHDDATCIIIICGD